VKRVLNVGGASKKVPIPAHYDGWDHVLLDIDPADEADVICDARTLTDLAAGQYDAIYCSHNLEHYWRHDVPAVLSGFVHVLHATGFAEVLVPDLKAVFNDVLKSGIDLDDVLYRQSGYEITPNDVIYGWGHQIELSGNDFYAHKNSFTSKSLTNALTAAGFPLVLIGTGFYELHALAFKSHPTEEQIELLQIQSVIRGS
jgi:methyltransferase family protein